MKYKLSEKRDRNKRLIEFAKIHPNWTQESIGKRFRISGARVSVILNGGDGISESNDKAGRDKK